MTRGPFYHRGHSERFSPELTLTVDKDSLPYHSAFTSITIQGLTCLVDWHEIKQLYLKPRDLFWLTAKEADNGFMTTRFMQKQLDLENIRMAYFRAVWRQSLGTVPCTVGVLPSRLQHVCSATYWSYAPNNWTCGSGNQGMGARLAPFPIALSDTLGKCVLLVPTWVGFWQISSLGSRWEWREWKEGGLFY